MVVGGRRHPCCCPQDEELSIASRFQNELEAALVAHREREKALVEEHRREVAVVEKRFGEQLEVSMGGL